MKDGCPARPDSHREHLKDDRGLDDPFVFQKDPVQQALVHAQAVFRLQQQQRCRAGKDVAGDLDGLHGAGAQQDAGLLGLPAILLRTALVKALGEDKARGLMDRIVLGDATQGLRYIDHLVSTRLADQIEIGVMNLRPWFEHAGVTVARMTKGTGSHVLGEGSSEILIGQQLAALYPDVDVQVVYHGLLDVDGVELDYAHHGPYPGSRAWLKGNVARYDLRSLMLNELSAGKVPARVMLRSHYHEWIPPETLGMEFLGETYWSTLVLTPSYCGLGAHGHQATRSTARQTHGMVAIEVLDGRLGEIRPFKRTLDLRTKERLG